MWSYIYYIFGWDLPQENETINSSNNNEVNNSDTEKKTTLKTGNLSKITNNCLINAKKGLKKIKKTIPIVNYPTQDELINNSISKNIKTKMIIKDTELIETKKKLNKMKQIDKPNNNTFVDELVKAKKKLKLS